MSQNYEIKLDKNLFEKRHKMLLSMFESEESCVNISGIAFINGHNDEQSYSKSLSLQEWLFGYELQDTIAIISKTKTVIITSRKRAEFLNAIKSNIVEIIIRNKDEDFTTKFEPIMKSCNLVPSSSSQMLGMFEKDRFTGTLAQSWYRFLDNAKFPKIDVSQAIANLLAPKDETELELMKLAAAVTSEIYAKFIRLNLLDIIDDERIVRHDKFSADIEGAIEDDQYIRSGIIPDEIDACFPPIVQSGGKYNLRFSAQCDKSKIEFDCIVVALGVRYKYYCSSLVRTLMVNPTEPLTTLYTFTLSLHDMLTSILVPGSKFSEIYNKIHAHVYSTHPEYIDNFVRSLGFASGIEFRENSFIIDPRSNSTLVENMVIVTMLGFQNVTLPDTRSPVCVVVGDTIWVKSSGTETFTTCKRTSGYLSVRISEEKVKVSDMINDEVIRKASSILPTRKRQPQLVATTNDEQRKAHQAKLKERLNEDARLRLIGNENKKDAKTESATLNAAGSYKSPAQVPKEGDIFNLKIYVDKTTETVIVPVSGMAVPYHISTLKSVSTNTEGNYTYLRMNFNVNIPPGNKMEDLSTTYGKNVFVKELIFRASNIKSASETHPRSAFLLSITNKIRDLQKTYKTRLQERTELQGIVQQPDLIINTSKMVPRLRELSIRPQLGIRRLQGTLEAHTNGFRYATSRGDHVDILYCNIEHAFFQPPDHETLIALHFHLKTAIMINKRKFTDVQLYTEIGEVFSDLGKSTANMMDRDEIEAEQNERETRNKLKSAFKLFTERVEVTSNHAVEFQIPFRELGFLGVPHKTSVFLVPTTSCLINIVEQPPFVVSIEDVELVHFERVGFNMKNFDMVLVFKDYKRKVSMISAIPMNYLEGVKDWLNSCDVRYNEGNQNLNWVKIMKVITDDPERFFASGGWSFLDMDDDNDDPDAKVDEDGDEEYQPDDSDDEVAVDESESDSDNYQSDHSVSESASEMDSEEGKSWSELEEEAKQLDALKHGEPLPMAVKRKHPSYSDQPHQKRFI